MNEPSPPLRDRLGRTGGAVVVIAAVVVLIAPIVSVFVAGSRIEGDIEWLPFLRTAALTWLGISVVTIVGVTTWLWLTWESPESGADTD